MQTPFNQLLHNPDSLVSSTEEKQVDKDNVAAHYWIIEHEWKQYAFDNLKFTEWLYKSVTNHYKNTMTDEDWKSETFIEDKWIKVRSIIDSKRWIELVSVFNRKQQLIAQLPLINFVYEVTSTENDSVNTVLSEWSDAWSDWLNDWNGDTVTAWESDVTNVNGWQASRQRKTKRSNG